jgi:outer membrane protein assembly factor BamA
MIRIGFYLIFLLICATRAFGVPTDPTILVSDIVVIGNRVTLKSVILREMNHRVGVPLKPELLPYDRDRIYSLGLFNRVEIYHHIQDLEATIYVNVHERWYIFPVPVFGMRDRDWNKLYYGLGVVHNNFRGRNEKLWGGFALGYDPWVSLAYSNPAILGREDIYIDVQLLYSKTQNKSIISQGEENNFDENRYGTDFNFGKRLSLYSSITVMTGFRAVHLSEYIPGHTMSPTGKDNYLVTGLSFRYDTRDVFEYPMYGTLVRASFFKSGLGESKVDHFRTSLDLRKYVPLAERLTIAGRALTIISGGRLIPHHGHIYIGYEERIRGHFRTVYEGENLFLSSIEARFRLLGPKYIEWKSAIAQEFAVLKYGVNLALFYDMGTVWFRNNDISRLRPARGYGGGVHLLLPYSTVFRIEYGLNEHSDGEFIFDMYVMF